MISTLANIQGSKHRQCDILFEDGQFDVTRFACQGDNWLWIYVNFSEFKKIQDLKISLPWNFPTLEISLP